MVIHILGGQSAGLSGIEEILEQLECLCDEVQDLRKNGLPIGAEQAAEFLQRGGSIAQRSAEYVWGSNSMETPEQVALCKETIAEVWHDYVGKLTH